MSTTVPVAVAAAPAAPHSRLVPAVVSGAQIYIECPAWCTVDHVESAEGDVADIWHGGDYADLNVPRMGKAPELLAFARLGLDPTASDPVKRSAFVFLDDGGEGYDMTPAQAFKFANDLEAFAAQVRAMAATVGDSDPDMDEALRRVRTAR